MNPKDENQKEESDFLEAIRAGERSAAEGNFITLEQLEKNLKEWISQTGKRKDVE